jgi:hypothetical protein
VEKLSKILKGDLYEFIKEKYTAEKTKIIEERSAIVEEYVRIPIKSNVSAEFKGVKKAIDIAHLEYEKFIEKFGVHEDYSYIRGSTYLHSVSSKEHDLVREEVGYVTDFLNGYASKYHGQCLTERVVEDIKYLYTPVNERLSKLEVLNDEIQAIVKASKSGKIAYDTLVSLDVDMKDFVAGTSNLPAVRQLSVDVCVINGGC